MNGSKLTEKQLEAAEKYILLRRASGNTAIPNAAQMVTHTWQGLVMLVAEYGALRAASMQHGGSVDEPGEIYLTGKCANTNRNAGYASCVKPAGHTGNHEDSTECWWR